MNIFLEQQYFTASHYPGMVGTSWSGRIAGPSVIRK